MANSDWTMDGMNDPLLLQNKLLDRFEKETGTAIVDPNNTPSLLMEAFADTTAGLVRKIEDTVRPAIYPARAKEAVDLYKHLSDYDYVNVFASPAQTTLLMTLDKAYVMANAMSFTDKDGVLYYKLVIPKTTIFTIGDHKFGLYYPIEIRCNVTTNRLYIVYDTSEVNPMHSLASNVLEYDIREVEGHDIIYLKIPVYQFKVDVYDDNVVIGSGYKRVITYEDRFYAIRARASVLQNPGHGENEDDEFAMEEIKLCASGMTYDTDKVTMVFTPDPDALEVTLEIPYIYFTKGLVNGDVEVEIYTTEGEINYTLPTIEEQEELELCTVDMFNRLVTDDGITPYVDPFRKMPSLSIVPLNSAVVGGSNGMDLDTLRKHVVNGTLQSKTLQTPADIDAYFDTRGYKTTILRDGVTDRIFLVHSSIQNVANEIISGGTLNTIFDFRPDNLKSYSTITGSDGGHIYTILPSTIYRFDYDKNVVVPLTDNERAELDALAPSDLVAEYNKSIYTVSPFHLQVDTSSSYPTSITYDMRDIEIKSRQFIGDRDSQEYQLILNAISIAVEKSDKDPLTDKFTLTFKVSSSGLEDVNPIVVQEDGSVIKNFRVICGLKNVDGSYNFGEAEYLRTEDNFHYFKLNLYSNYVFHQDSNEHSVEMTMYGNDSELTSIYYLTSEMRVMLTINGDIGNIKDPDGDGIITTSRGIVTDYTNAPIVADADDFYALTEYRLACKFGSVVDELDQRINLTYSQMEYLRYGYTKFKVLSKPVYKTDSRGDLVIIENPSTHKWETITLYPAGLLECMSETIEETIMLNPENIVNYVGLEVTDPPDTAESAIVPGNPTEQADRGWLNKSFTFKEAPTIPRFKVTDASDIEGTSTIAIGTYEILNAVNAKATATPNDKWVKLAPSVNIRGVSLKWVDNFVVEDVLDFIYKNATSKSHVEMEDYTPTVGEFIIEHSISGTEFDELEDGSPIIGPVIETTRTWCRILYCYSSKLAPVVLGRFQEIGTPQPLLGVSDGSNNTEDHVVTLCDIIQNGGWVGVEKVFDPVTGEQTGTRYHHRYCGYIYHARMHAHSTITDTDVSQEFVHFFRMRKLSDGAIVPDLSFSSKEIVPSETLDHLPQPLATDANRIILVEGMTGGVWVMEFYQGVDVGGTVNWQRITPSKDIAWHNYCEKYPWDVSNWYGLFHGEEIDWIKLDNKFTIDLDETRMYRYLVHSGKQYDLDEKGNLQEDKNADTRHIQYMISMLQLDAKHTKVTAQSGEKDFVSSITDVLRRHFDILGNTRNEMFTNTRLFFEAFKSIGYGSFRVGPDVTENLQLDIEVSLRLHVSSDTAADATLRDSIKSQIVYIIDTKLQSGYLNLNEVANQVMTDLAGTVLMVDVLGINGRPDIQTLKSMDNSVRPHLKHSLVLLNDESTIDVTRGLNLEFVVDD